MSPKGTHNSHMSEKPEPGVSPVETQITQSPRWVYTTHDPAMQLHSFFLLADDRTFSRELPG